MAPRENGLAYAWSLAAIRDARDQQMAGRFALPARLAEGFRTDDALFVAYNNRLAPQRAIKVALKAAAGARGLSIANEAEGQFGQDGVAIRSATKSDVNGCLANHGVAFAYNTATVREDGSRIDFAVKYWPIEHVWWDSFERCFKTLTVDGAEERIIHGNGRWVVFAKHEVEPWKNEAAVLPGALVWARHAFGNRDWAKGSLAHGSAKVIGEMPAGVRLQDEKGALTKEAKAFGELLKAIASSELPVGIRPAGSKTDFLANNSTAWQVWKELTTDAKKSAARIYLGTDGVLGATGGAPGVDITALFGVASTIVQGDFECIEQGFNTGSIEPWTALNFGDSTLAPKLKYQVPDPDADAKREERQRQRTAFHEEIEKARSNGFDITQEYVDALAKEYGVENPPRLASTPPASGVVNRAA